MAHNKYRPSGKYPETNPHPVLSSSFDGDIMFINPSAMKALRDTRVKHIGALLPANHMALVRACIQSGSPVRIEHSVNGFTFLWSYQPVTGEQEIYIYGCDVTLYQNLQQTTISEELLVCLYGLTPAETRVTRHLLRGYTLKEAAKKLGIAVTTVRSHLKVVFEKTGTSRQSELIRCVLMNRSTAAAIESQRQLTACHSVGPKPPSNEGCHPCGHLLVSG